MGLFFARSLQNPEFEYLGKFVLKESFEHFLSLAKNNQKNPGLEIFLSRLLEEWQGPSLSAKASFVRIDPVDWALSGNNLKP